MKKILYLLLAIAIIGCTQYRDIGAMMEVPSFTLEDFKSKVGVPYSVNEDRNSLYLAITSLSKSRLSDLPQKKVADLANSPDIINLQLSGNNIIAYNYLYVITLVSSTLHDAEYINLTFQRSGEGIWTHIKDGDIIGTGVIDVNVAGALVSTIESLKLPKDAII